MLASPHVFPRKLTALASLDNRPDALYKAEKNHSPAAAGDAENIPSARGAARSRLSAAPPALAIKPLSAAAAAAAAATIKPKLHQRRRRMSPEQLRLMSRRIDPTQPLPSPHTSPSKPALPVLYSPSPRKRARAQQQQQQQQQPRCPLPAVASADAPAKAQAQLFQTCFDIWPGAPSLGEFAHDNVKCLSELLKVRLSQAKFRLIAALEADNCRRDDPLYAQLKTESDDSWPFTLRQADIALSHKRHQSAIPVTVGNGKNLTGHPRQRRAVGSAPPPPPARHVRLVTDDSGKLSVAVTPPPSPANGKKRKRAVDRPCSKKSAKTMTPQTLSPVHIIRTEDDTHPFYCKPCNKRYKNRSGLVYHLQRCKHRATEANIHCTCEQQHTDRAMIFCDTCHCWLHSDCVGMDEQATHETYECPRCSPVKSERQSMPVLVAGTDMQDTNWWPLLATDDYSSPWNLPVSDIPSLLFSDPLNNNPEDDIGLMTPSSIAQQDQSDTGWFEFANFDDDFTCE